MNRKFVIKKFTLLSLLFSLVLIPASIVAQNLTAAEQQYLKQVTATWQSLDKQQGLVLLPNGMTTLTVPDNFYYLSPVDSEKVLVDIWGNLPGAGLMSQGVLLPADITPFEAQSWAVSIEYEAEGYVSDEDAQEFDYQSLLLHMQASTAAANQSRMTQGFESIELIGWAETPFYDKRAHKLYWAQELKFGDEPNHTLNYNIRVLGREAVLVLNFVASMKLKPEIDRKIDTVLAMAEFNKGARYEDFDPDLDKVAAYGVGALVAGNVITQRSIFPTLLNFAKKFSIAFFILLVLLIRKILVR